MNFKIENENFELKFGFGVFFILGKHWSFKSYNEALQRIVASFGSYANLDETELQNQEFDLPLETLEVLADVVIAAVVANKQNGKSFNDFFLPDVINAVVQNMDLLPELMKELIASIPTQKPPVETPGK